MRRLFYFLVFLVIIVFGVSFALKNPDLITIKYYFDISWTVKLAALLAAALAIGAVLGVLLTSMWVLRSRRRLSQAKREVRKMEQEISNLRALPIKDDI